MNQALEARGRLLQRITEVLIFALCVFLPLAFGGVMPSGNLVALAATAGMALLLGIRCLLGAPFVVSLVYVPGALFLLFVALQSLPLPMGIVAGIAPKTADAWQSLLGEVSATAPEHATLSLYPYGTATDLRLLLAGAVLFVIVVNTYRHRPELRRLLGSVAFAGGLVATIGVLQNLTGTDKLLWIWPSPAAIATAGPFVHYGHFSQFVNLGMGSALALLLVRLGDRTGKDRHDAKDLVSDLRLVDRRVDLLLLLCLVVGMIAIAMSRSRNGVISMLVAGAVTAAIMHWTRYLKGMGWPLGILALIAFVMLLLVGFDPIYERMATLADTDVQYEGRGALLRDSLAAVREHKITGVGQGAFEFAFPAYDTSERAGRAQHAENQYMELLVETGVLGFAIAAAFAGLVLFGWVRKIRRRQGATDAVLFGLAYGVIAVMFHAFTDFGLRIPAVAALLVIALAVVVGRAPSLQLAGAAGRVVGGVFGIGSAVLLAVSIPAVRAAWTADEHWRLAQALGAKAAPLTGKARYDALREEHLHLREARNLVPDNVEYRLRVAVVGWELALSVLPGDIVPSPETTPELIQVARRARAELIEAIRCCPTYGLPWALLGQFGLRWLGDEKAAGWIRHGRALSPEEPDVCMAAAALILAEGDATAAAKEFARATRMGAGEDRVATLLVLELDRPDVAREVARGQVWGLINLMQKLRQKVASLTTSRPASGAETATTQPTSKSASAPLEGMIKDVRMEARTLLQAIVAKPDAPDYSFAYLAQFCVEDGDEAGAIAHYRRFLTKVPTHPARFELAQLLAKAGETEAARNELQRILNYDPFHGAAKELLKRLR